MKINNILKLVISIAVCEAAGVIGGLFTAPALQSGWYAALAKPELAPPSWIFGPVWTTLYALMGVSAWLVWSSYASADAEASADKKKRIKAALILFDLQLFLNILWSIIFFGLHSPGGALIEIIFLWLAILVTIIAFAKISRVAAWLLVPYLVWVSFALYLNYAIWALN